jgi:hypothetical protein
MRSFMALLLALACLSCGGSGAPAKTARDVSGEAYTAAVLVWLWADSATRAEFRAASDIAIEAIGRNKDEIAKQCGSEAQECAEKAWVSFMQGWAGANDYAARVKRLERGRAALVLWDAALNDEHAQPLEHARTSVGLIALALDDLRDRGAKIPLEVMAAMALAESVLGKVPPGTIVSMARPLGAQ